MENSPGMENETGSVFVPNIPPPQDSQEDTSPTSSRSFITNLRRLFGNDLNTPVPRENSGRDVERGHAQQGIRFFSQSSQRDVASNGSPFFIEKVKQMSDIFYP